MSNKITTRPTCPKVNRNGVRCGLPVGHDLGCQNGHIAPPSSFDRSLNSEIVEQDADYLWGLVAA